MIASAPFSSAPSPHVIRPSHKPSHRPRHLQLHPVPQEAPVRSVEWTPPVNPVLRWRNGVKPWYGVPDLRAVDSPRQGRRK
jgi:hypothetical protein